MMKFLPTLVFCISWQFFSFAQGFQVNLQGQKQQAMGSAACAAVQDASSLFYNPGSTCFLRNNSILAGVSTTFGRSAFQDSISNSVSRTVSPVGTPFTFYSAFSVKDSTSKMKMGLGVYTPFGSGIRWEDEWTGRFALTSIKLLSIFIQPTISYRINNQIGIGAGFIFATGSVTLKKDIPVVDANGTYGNATLQGSANGSGFNTGVYFTPNEKLSFGLSYRSQVNMNVDNGSAEFQVPSSLEANFPNGNFTSSLPLPSVLTAGFALKLKEKILIAGDVNYVGWSAYKALEFDYEKNTSSLKDTRSERNYKNTFAFRAGVQYRKDDKIFLRGGLSYVISPVQAGYVTPETPDATRLNVAGGFSYIINKKISVDASFTYQRLKRADTNLETQLSGTYKTFVYIPGIGLVYTL
jgi:long-chain fatty acid transport protein